MDVSRQPHLDLVDSKENNQAVRVGFAHVENPPKLLILWRLAERVGFKPRLFNEINKLGGANGKSNL